MKLNVLAISHYHTGANRTFEDYCYGIKANSNEYYYIDYKNDYTKLGKKRLESKIIDLVKTKGINCIFFYLWARDFTFDILFIERLSKLTKIIMMFSDSYYSFEDCDSYYAQLADLVILPAYLEKFQFELIGINAMTTFSLFNKNAYLNDKIITQDIDISFVGNTSKSNRAEFIAFIENNGLKVETFGRKSKNGFVDFDKMIQIFNSTKININFTGTENYKKLMCGKKKLNRIKIIPGRIIEIALCGGFVLSEYAPGIEKMFRIGEEIDVFYSKEDLVKKIKYYLDNDQRRQEIANQCYKHSISSYNSTTAFKKILYNLQKLPKQEKVLFLDDIFLKNYVAYRIMYLGRFLLKFNLKLFLEEILIILKVRKISPRLFYLFTFHGISVIFDKFRQERPEVLP